MVECIPETPAVRQQKQGNQKFKVIFSYRDREQLDTWNPTPKTSRGPPIWHMPITTTHLSVSVAQTMNALLVEEDPVSQDLAL